jgi:cytochrome c peroxidase
MIIKGNRKANIRLHPVNCGISLVVVLALLIITSCKKDEPDNGGGTGEVWNPTPYDLEIPAGFPDMQIPADNPMTEEGVFLGRKLFYDPILSGDNTMSCASCHDQAFSFTDHGNRFSTGINGDQGFRNTMSLLNIGWTDDLNWDGSAIGLEGQAFEPVANPIEMHEEWPNAVSKLKSSQEYPDLFFDAFGTRDFDSTHVVKALAQFERTLISSDSKWDRYLRGEVQLSVAETKGFEIFFTERGDCFHCHSTILFTDNIFHNNGLDSVFADEGLFKVTGDPNDLGKFRTPTLRNVELTAPYMHDGRFATLEEVIEFYSTGLKFSPTVDPLMKNVNQGGVQLTQEEKESLMAFIKTLTDTTFVNNPDFGNITKQ